MNNNTIKWSLIGLLVIAIIWLVADHGQHLIPYLPFAFLLGCLVMHVFMHSGHGGHTNHGNNGDDGRNRQDPDQHNH